MTMNKLTSICATVCVVLAAACDKDDEGESGNSSLTLGEGTGTAGDDADDDADDDGMSATMPADDTMSPESSGGPADSTGGSECTVDDECMTDAMCPGSMCIGCICTDVGDDSSGGNPTSSDYGMCGACAAGEMPVGLMGVEGCFCSPTCEGMGSACPAPTSGMVAGQCILELMMGAGATQCALICMPGMEGQCPDGATCEMVPMQTVGICMYPAPM
jgi:hypothetical protein